MKVTLSGSLPLTGAPGGLFFVGSSEMKNVCGICECVFEHFDCSGRIPLGKGTPYLHGEFHLWAEGRRVPICAPCMCAVATAIIKTRENRLAETEAEFYNQRVPEVMNGKP